ncbi:hypothetical protein CU097_002081 [Rhizopus azygosporus]|uniref:Uncharacterized protein n=1 Tax=Rhizopus azygosporus TaxID=86630 RepID=A0A367JTB7_RHIAZ|nr:hypothetical protein CU097_002081 [Rhizopus azygosporus]
MDNKLAENLNDQPHLVSEGPDTLTPKNTAYEQVPLREPKRTMKENLAYGESQNEDYSPLQADQDSVQDFRKSDWDSQVNKGASRQ